MMKANSPPVSKTYEGWLNSPTFIFKIWSRRWYTLNGLSLSFYFSPKGKVRGTISLQDSKIEIDNESKKKFAFKITTPKKIYSFQASTEEELNQWMDAIMINNGQKITKISIEDFDILKVLGRGSLGKVQLARYKRTNKLYALKSISKAKFESIKSIVQVINEKNALVSISHPFIVSAEYAFQTETYIFIAMDYVPGGELLKQLEIEAQNDETSYSEYRDSYEESNSHKEAINLDLTNCKPISYYDNYNYGGFTVRRGRLYAAQLALSIQYLHSIGFVHRDLKPSNILIDKDGYIKLIDFGFVKEKMFGIFAQTSTFCGTPMYAAPEIIKRKPYGRSVDWWSFGVILYELIFYDTPFFSQNMNTLFQKITDENFTFHSKFSIEGETKNGSGENEIPFVLYDFLNKLLTKDPRDRLGTYDEEEIFNHPFFDGIEWKKLINKEVQMEWKPDLKDENDVSCFYDQFTKEKPKFSVVDPLYILDETNEALTNFTYINADGVLSNF